MIRGAQAVIITVKTCNLIVVNVLKGLMTFATVVTCATAVTRATIVTLVIVTLQIAVTLLIETAGMVATETSMTEIATIMTNKGMTGKIAAQIGMSPMTGWAVVVRNTEAVAHIELQYCLQKLSSSAMP